MLPLVEIRARRELLRKALTRLAAGDEWTRRDLFASTSAQATKIDWQRRVMRRLAEDGLVIREGPLKMPLYHAIDVEALEQLAADSDAIDRVIREATRHPNERDSVDSVVEPDMFEDGAGEGEAEAEAPEGADIGEQMFKLIYMTAEAVSDVRERLDRMEQTLADLSKTIKDALWLVIDAKTKELHESNTPQR